MATFIIPVNPQMSDIGKVSQLFREDGSILWIHKKRYPKYHEGDIIYMCITGGIKKIRFKVRVEGTDIQATADDLKKYTWIKKSDWKKQIENNCNDKFTLIEELDKEQSRKLSRSCLNANGFQGFERRLPTEITDNDALIRYIESVINRGVEEV